MSTSSQPTSPAQTPATSTGDRATRGRLRWPSFTVQILIALAIGVGLGFLAQALGENLDGSANGLTVTLETIGSSYVTLLKAIVVPLVLLAIIASVANLRKVTNAARLAGKTLLWFAVTALISVAIGIVIGLVTKPGHAAGISTSEAADPSRTGTWLDFLTGLIPGNFLGIGASTQLAEGASGSPSATTSISFNTLQLIVVGLVIGLAALKSGKKAEPFLTFTDSALAVVQKVLWWVIRLSPLGTLGLIGYAVVEYGPDFAAPLALFTVDVYLGLALVLFGLYPLLLRLNGLSVSRFFRGAWPAIQLAFVSRSSIGTLPVTERVTERNLGVPREYASFAVPLGATTKMDGCAAIYPALAAIFIAQVFGVQLDITDYLLIAFVAVIGSAATAGVTGATVMLTLTLSTLGLPLAGVGLLVAIDPILDMGRTAVNVAGQALVPTIVAAREKILDRTRYDSASSENLFDDAADKAEETERDRTEARELTPVG